jgi:uncharacterized protein (TIGR02145 family)
LPAQTNYLKVYKNNSVVYQEEITAIDSIIFVSIEYIEEGVAINGIVWATRNVGAHGTFVTNPEDAGMFYQWNRNVGWSSTDPMTNSNGGTTWDTSTPAGSTWEESNNVCPTGWRVPTQAELQSLEASGSTWTTINGKTGRIFGTEPNTIFLPATGYRSMNNGELINPATRGDYWSSTTYTSGPDYASDLFFADSFIQVSSNSHRKYGISVRCVAE